MFIFKLYWQSVCYQNTFTNLKNKKKNLILDGRYVAKQKVLQCKGTSSTNPIANRLFKCNLNDSYIIQFDSGDEYIFIIYY
jgi:hypothetical protein